MRPNDGFMDLWKTASGIPAPLVGTAVEVVSCRESWFDQSYMDFLDTQIGLDARGPQWTDRLRRRRAALATMCGMRLISATVRTAGSGSTFYSVHIDPVRKAVVHWEEYEWEELGH